MYLLNPDSGKKVKWLTVKPNPVTGTLEVYSARFFAKGTAISCVVGCCLWASKETFLETPLTALQNLVSCLETPSNGTVRTMTPDVDTVHFLWDRKGHTVALQARKKFLYPEDRMEFGLAHQFFPLEQGGNCRLDLDGTILLKEHAAANERLSIDIGKLSCREVSLMVPQIY
jgi:hypothetical protein